MPRAPLSLVQEAREAQFSADQGQEDAARGREERVGCLCTLWMGMLGLMLGLNQGQGQGQGLRGHVSHHPQPGLGLL